MGNLYNLILNFILYNKIGKYFFKQKFAVGSLVFGRCGLEHAPSAPMLLPPALLLFWKPAASPLALIQVLGLLAGLCLACD